MIKTLLSKLTSLIVKILPDWLTCEHVYVFDGAITEQNLRSGFKHRSLIYVCQKCHTREIREQNTL